MASAVSQSCYITTHGACRAGDILFNDSTAEVVGYGEGGVMAQQSFGLPPHGFRTPVMPRLKLPSLVPGILLIFAGALGLALALIILITPMFLFLLGGGGNVDAFDDFAAGFTRVSFIVAAAALAILVLGIVLTVTAAKKRWRIRFAAMGWPPPR